MRDRIVKLFPEIDWVQDAELKEKVVATLENALKMGGWEPEDMEKLPFTLLIPDCPCSLLTHFRGVVRISKASMDEFNALYDFKLDNDTLMAGAILHDVGKLVEYERNSEGKVVKSPVGKDLRHPFSGVGLAMMNGIPTPICHCIAVHAGEGDGRHRSPEAVVINKADFTNFETLKSFLGLL
ncbi:MAG: HD domain-containing protein [Synergistota bacterium]|nr:HD domain-containing protein [Synergistota bacterium]